MMHGQKNIKLKITLIEQNSKISGVTDDHVLKLKEDRQGTYYITLQYDKKMYKVHVQHKLFLSDFNET